MRLTAVQKAAKALNVLILFALACNVVLLYLVPTAVMFSQGGFLEGARGYLSGLLHPDEDDIVMAGVAGSVLAWFWFWGDAETLVPVLSLLLSGGCTAVILWQARRVLGAILRGKPFSLENAAALRRAAWCCFLVSAGALVYVVWGIFVRTFQLSLAAALFVPVFFAGGLLCLVMSALFRQAAELKAENDLTI